MTLTKSILKQLPFLSLIAIVAFILSAALTGCDGGETPTDAGTAPQQMEAPANGGAPDADAPANGADGSQSNTPTEPADAPAAAVTAGIPRLVDLGSKQCIPCQMMAPILDELTNEYAGRMEIVFIDVWLPENEAIAEAYGITSIPTQIFYDGAGRELARHVGFMSKEDILGKWKELGIDLS